jgi:hypothetical protein
VAAEAVAKQVPQLQSVAVAVADQCFLQNLPLCLPLATQLQSEPVVPAVSVWAHIVQALLAQALHSVHFSPPQAVAWALVQHMVLVVRAQDLVAAAVAVASLQAYKAQPVLLEPLVMVVVAVAVTAPA